jgi:AP-2 complex subunit alpha
VGDVLRASATAMDQEVQQRSVEYLALGGANLVSVKGQVLEMMPHFTERESIVQKTLSKTQADASATMPARSTGTGSGASRPDDDDDEDAAPQGARASEDAGGGPNLMGGGGHGAPQPAAEDLLGGLSLVGDEVAAAPPPPVATSAVDDILDLMGGGAPAPPQQAMPKPADALSGVLGAGPTMPPSAPAGPAATNAAQLAALCLRDEGVLHEDDAVQIGVKMEFQAHQGRLAVFIGNKSGTTPLSDVSSQISAQPALALQPSPLASVVGPRQQQSQVILIQCGGAYGEPPQIMIKFTGPAGPVQLVLPLPLPPTKFNAPLSVDGPEFFRRWKLFDQIEKQLVFKVDAAALARVEPTLAGFKFAVLKQVDPNPSNFVAAGCLMARGAAQPQADNASLLVRLEINLQAGMCRASVRSPSADMNAVVAKNIASQLS